MRDALLGQAREFAQDLCDLLNRTVCNGVRLTPTFAPGDRSRVIVGHGLRRDNPFTSHPFPLRLGRERPACYLDLSYRLCLDEEAEYLTVSSSYIGVLADAEGRLPLCHYDYERGKADGYPEAHLQVVGIAPALQAACAPTGRDDTLAKLHFPVGGRRFRPALEDVIEFLVVERLVAARPGWRDVLDRHRAAFHRMQLRAAIRRDPATAAAAVRDFRA